MGTPKKLKTPKALPVAADAPAIDAPVSAQSWMPPITPKSLYTVVYEGGEYRTRRYAKALAFTEGLLAAGAIPTAINCTARS